MPASRRSFAAARRLAGALAASSLLAGCPTPPPSGDAPPAPPLQAAAQPSAALQGEVIGAEGKPVAGATVRLRSLETREASRSTGKTDSLGRFSLPLAGLAPGTCWLVTAGEGSATTAAFWRLPAAGARGLAAAESGPFFLRVDAASTIAWLVMPSRYLAAGLLAGEAPELREVIARAYERLAAFLPNAGLPLQAFLATASWGASGEEVLSDATLQALHRSTFGLLIDLSAADLASAIRKAYSTSGSSPALPAAWLKATTILPPVFSSGGSGPSAPGGSPSPGSTEGDGGTAIQLQDGGLVNDPHPETIGP